MTFRQRLSALFTLKKKDSEATLADRPDSDEYVKVEKAESDLPKDLAEGKAAVEEIIKEEQVEEKKKKRSSGIFNGLLLKKKSVKEAVEEDAVPTAAPAVEIEAAEPPTEPVEAAPEEKRDDEVEDSLRILDDEGAKKKRTLKNRVSGFFNDVFTKKANAKKPESSSRVPSIVITDVDEHSTVAAEDAPIVASPVSAKVEIMIDFDNIPKPDFDGEESNVFFVPKASTEILGREVGNVFICETFEPVKVEPVVEEKVVEKPAEKTVKKAELVKEVKPVEAKEEKVEAVAEKVEEFKVAKAEEVRVDQAESAESTEEKPEEKTEEKPADAPKTSPKKNDKKKNKKKIRKH